MFIRLVLACATLVACGADGPGGHDPGDVDDVIGATCIDDRDCYAKCARGDDLVGGFCTLPCRDDRDCTTDTVCTDTHDGICLFACRDHADCDLLGPSYFCREKRDFFDRAVFVCMSD